MEKEKKCVQVQNHEYKFNSVSLFIVWLGFVISPALLDVITNTIFQESKYSQLLIELISSILIFLILYSLSKKNNVLFSKMVGLNFSETQNNLRFLLIGFLFGLFFASVKEIISYVFKFVTVRYDPNNFWEIFIYAVCYSLFIAVFQEMFYRGFLQTQLSKRMSQSMSIFVIAFLTMASEGNYTWSWELISIFTTALFFGLLFAYSNNIYLGIGWKFMRYFVFLISSSIFNYAFHERDYISTYVVFMDIALILLIILFSCIKNKYFRA